MLSMNPMSSDQAGYYLNLAKEDYYLDGGEPPGKWFGSGAQKLELGETVQATQLYNLFDGQSPDGKFSLVQRQSHRANAVHLPGWDLTFSAPKSVSVFWSQAPPEVRADIQKAHDDAVRTALEFLEITSMYSRTGQGGRRLEHVGMTAALFEHSTSRALDPHLHTHALVLNVAMREDGKPGAASALHLFEAKMAGGALYRAELAHLLESRLGLPVRREESWFEIDKVSQQLMDFFSKRREAIVGELERKGLSTAQAAAVAAIETRDAKTDINRSQLFEGWHVDGDAHRWSADAALRLLGSAKERKRPEMERVWALERATKKLTSDQAHFTFKDFVRRLAEEAQDTGIGAREVLSLASEHLAKSPAIVRLGEHEGAPRFTTVAMFELERDLLDDAQALHSSSSHQVPVDKVMRVLSRRSELSEEQMKAVLHLTHESGDIGLMSGVAGSGKTTALQTAKELWEGQGYRVLGTSLYSKATRQLQESTGIESKTVAKLSYELNPDQFWEGMEEAEKEIHYNYGPDVRQPFRKLARLYGPDILHPLRPLIEEHGPNIIQPLAELAEKYGPNILEPFKGLASKYSPDVGQLWRTLGDYLTKKLDEFWRSPITSRTILVVDEAPTIATPAMGELVAACRNARGKIVLVGDPNQTQPIGPGAPFPSLADRFGVAALTDIRRQNEAWERKAIKSVLAGDAKEALREYTKQGRVRISETHRDAVSQLVSDWEQDGMPLDNALIIAGTNKDVDRLNTMVQQVREARGQLGDDYVSHEGQHFHVGDRVVFTKSSKTRGVDNRSAASVLKVDPISGVLRLQLDSKRKISIALEEFGYVKLGYAVTAHVAQGATVNKAYVLASGKWQDKELSYVEISRARESTKIYTTMEQAGDDLSRLAKQMETSRQKQLAHDVLQQQPRLTP